jgi:glycosyltransferase involved in cell wall biosynthesis
MASHDLHERVTVMAYSPELWALMKRAQVVVSPSLFEGRPNTVLEAMACRVPLVVSDIPEHREILDGASAMLVSPSSPGDLANAIERTLADRAASQARVAVAAERVARYDVASIAQEYSGMYRNVIRREGPR